MGEMSTLNLIFPARLIPSGFEIFYSIHFYPTDLNKLLMNKSVRLKDLKKKVANTEHLKIPN
jgi:hypothetical protein